MSTKVTACAKCIGFNQKIARLERTITEHRADASPGFLLSKEASYQLKLAKHGLAVHMNQVHGK